MIKPSKDRVVVEKIVQPESKIGNIIVPDGNRRIPAYGKVLGVNDDSETKYEVGSTVLYLESGTYPCLTGDKEVILVDVDGIIGTLE